MKKSRIIALLSVCVLMFAVVQPAFAWGNRTGSKTGDAVVYGAGAGTLAAIGGAAVIFFTGGLATPVVVGVALGTTACTAGGAYYGYNVEEKSLLKDAGVIAGAGVTGAVTTAAAPVVAGTLTVGEAAVALGNAGKAVWEASKVVGEVAGVVQGVQFLFGADDDARQ